MARFFIDRPIFAWVIAIVVMLVGIISIISLPIAQYPSIAPPAITISATYPGASAKTLEDTVTQVIEQKMKGLDGLMYLSSSSESSGSLTMTLTFENGVDPDIAQVQVQNKLALANPLLPQEVQQQGVQVAKSQASFLALVAFVSENGSMDANDLTDYVAANLQDPISRVQGVGDTQLFGSQYSMRIWLDPNKLYNFKLTPADVTAAIQAQNVQVAAGQLGGLPAVSGQQLNASITAQTRLRTASEFENILLRTQTNGSEVRLRDVARVELGSESYGTSARYNGKPAAGIAVKLQTGANALQTIKLLRTKLDELKPFFPAGMTYKTPYDTTPFVRISLTEVVKTLVEAIVLVFLVMYLFLQNLRATLIPTIAVPVVLLGTFGVLAAFGYSINTLTMFAMVLAIGLLVDDAIVVVENVERVMEQDGLAPLEATRKSMDQITGALVGIALVLAAVFVPMAFFGGSTGIIYRQFSVTIVAAMALSVLVALILTPALCATMLKPLDKEGRHAHAGGSLGRFFDWFNRVFGRATDVYVGRVSRMLGQKRRYILIYAIIALVMCGVFFRLPSGFLPEEDQGTIFAVVQLPPGATYDNTLKVMQHIEHHFLVDQKDAVDGIITVAGFSFAGSGQNAGQAFIALKPWNQRNSPELKAQAVAAKAMADFSKMRGAIAFAFAPPAVSELGNASGFDLELQDRANLGHEKLMQARNQLLGMSAQNPELMGVRPNGQEDTPEFKLEIDQQKASALGVSLGDVNATFSTAWGSSYVNDFIDRGRVKKVFMQADAPFRMNPEDIGKWYVRNSAGSMVPFSSFSQANWASGSPRLERYNGLPSVEILGQPAPGVSTGAAMQAMEDNIAKLPAGIGYEWTGLSLQEKLSGSQAPTLYAISILVVFLCLAALYESWAVPVSVILVIPLGVIGALAATSLRGLANDVYFQVGLLTTVGLASKNAILIVEFAKDLHDQGESLVNAAIKAARMRLRPILMTSIAFIMGVLPMVLANGAGSGSQNAIGTAVTGGMLSATFLAIFFIPMFFVMVRSAFASKPGDARDATALPASTGVST